jgi:hypothetical protein
MDGDVGFDSIDSGQQQQQGGINPAWNDMLNDIPQELHAKVTPHLQNWDKGVNDRFQKVHSEYEPWKPLVKSGADPETVGFAVNLLNALEQDPRSVYEAIGNYYKDQLGDVTTSQPSGQGQQGPNNQNLDDKPWLNDMQGIMQQNEMLTRAVVAQRQEQENRAADAALDEELSSLKTKYGNYDEKYVLALISVNPGMTGEQAVQAWQQSIKSYAEQMGFSAGPKPFIMGGGSAIPGNGADVKKLDDKGTKDLVVQYLTQHAAQTRQ